MAKLFAIMEGERFLTTFLPVRDGCAARNEPMTWTKFSEASVYLDTLPHGTAKRLRIVEFEEIDAVCAASKAGA